MGCKVEEDYRVCAEAGWKGEYQGMSKMAASSLDPRIRMTCV